MKRIAVGIDGSRMARDALKWAATLAEHLDAEVLALNCMTHPYAEVSPEDLERLLRDRELTAAQTWVRPGWEARAEVETVVKPGDPRTVLLSSAQAHHADMIVLGRTGAGGGHGSSHVGAVVDQVVHDATMPVAVIPPGWSHPIERIIVGVDGSPESLGALGWVQQIAPAFKATVAVVMVEEGHWEATSPSAQEWQRIAEQTMQKWTAPLRAAGIDVTEIAQRDIHPVAGLLGVAAAREGDLLVIGRRGFGGIAGLYTGRVARKVLHYANLPVIIVPATT